MQVFRTPLRINYQGILSEVKGNPRAEHLKEIAAAVLFSNYSDDGAGLISMMGLKEHGTSAQKWHLEYFKDYWFKEVHSVWGSGGDFQSSGHWHHRSADWDDSLETICKVVADASVTG